MGVWETTGKVATLDPHFQELEISTDQTEADIMDKSILIIWLHDLPVTENFKKKM